MRIALIRQQPSIGDCLLLSPLIRELKAAHPGAHLTVVTDPTYLGGALPKIFEGIPGVDRIDQVTGQEWLPGLPQDAPYSVRTADHVFDCNTAFLDHEREHNGAPPYGIAEFWLRHWNRWHEGIDMRPSYKVDLLAEAEVGIWLDTHNPSNKPIIGIVMQAGAPARDWDFRGMSGQVCDWANSNGYLPISIDLTKQPNSVYCTPCVGKRIDFVAALLQKCQVVLTPDTGLLHLAEAVGAKTVALWGIMDPRLRIAGYNTVRVPPQSMGYCQGAEEAQCQCWKLQRWSCMRRILLSQVINGLQEALR